MRTLRRRPRLLTAALKPVYLVAAAISVFAFLLSWLLPDLPLRKTHGAEGLGEAFVAPRGDDSERELERVLSESGLLDPGHGGAHGARRAPTA